ncbi:MAG: hypothetical protein PHH91_00415 [Desulfuromonadaceae bacterium]|nr:hypothetical protein [Desulfuromonadaceae bacterium]
MKLFIVGLFFTAGTMLGCAQNHFNIPTENFADKVKVLGVAPIFIDADSDINHPQKELLMPLIADLNRKYEPLLVRKLRSTGNFNAVIPLADEPQQLFSSLTARREKRDDAGIQYNKYFWKNDAIDAYTKKSRLDAVMVIVVSGLTQTSKIFSSNLLSSLETDYNYLTMTAQIIAPDGTILWEYPNFRARLLTYHPLVNLQYPDFSESEANRSRKTEVRFKSLDGIRRILEQKKSDWLFRETDEPEIYGRLFDEMSSLIKYTGDTQTKGEGVERKLLPSPDESLKRGEPHNKPATAGPAQAPVAAVKTEANVPVPATTVETTGIPTTAPSEIVPATGSTL